MEEALHNATNPDEFKMRLAGILSAEQAIDGMSSGSKAAQRGADSETESIFVKH
jgi:hypothetical protein